MTTTSDREIYQILKGIAWEVSSRTAILRSAGFPSEHIPTNSTSSDEFWDEVNERITNGLVAVTHRQIHEAAADRYKGNPLLQMFRKNTAKHGVLREGKTGEHLLILCASSSPLGLAHMDIGFEMRALDEMCGRLALRVQLKRLDAVRFEDLRRELLSANPHVLHFSGHADQNGALFLHGERFGHERIDGKFIIDLLAALRAAPASRLRILFLNACFSDAVMPLADAAQVDVIGWDGPVYDGEAATVSPVFYEAYAASQDIETAYRLANQALTRHRLKMQNGRIGLTSEKPANLVLKRPSAHPAAPSPKPAA